MAIKASAPLADAAQLEPIDVFTPDPVAAPRQTAIAAPREAGFGTTIHIDRNGHGFV